MKINKKRTFTLAEVLIVIGVIGVVAAITIPSLVAFFQEKVAENRKEVIEDRLIQGMNQLNTLDDGFNASQYTDTEGFVRALSRHYKMSQICGADNIKNCFPYEEFSYTKNNKIETFKIADLKKPENFSLNKDEWLAPAGFISAQGTSFIMLLKKNCVMDTGTGMRAIPTSCVQYMYDNNGSNLPNKMGIDLESSNLIKIASGKKEPDGTFNVPIDGYTTYYYLGTNYEVINTCSGSEDEKYNFTRCGTSDCYYLCERNEWGGARKACAEAGYEMPTVGQLTNIFCRAKGEAANNQGSYGCSSRTKDINLYNVLRTPIVAGQYLFSSTESNSAQVKDVYFSDGRDGKSYVSDKRPVICIGKD